jgi:hypothetical protein
VKKKRIRKGRKEKAKRRRGEEEKKEKFLSGYILSL